VTPLSNLKTPNSSVTILCSLTGLTRFQVWRDGDPSTTDTFVVNILSEELAGCYSWYFVTIDDANEVNSVVSFSSNLVAKLWVIDPLLASAREKTITATTPSKV
jgi:hypothetical protein